VGTEFPDIFLINQDTHLEGIWIQAGKVASKILWTINLSNIAMRF